MKKPYHIEAQRAINYQAQCNGGDLNLLPPEQKVFRSRGLHPTCQRRSFPTPPPSTIMARRIATNKFAPARFRSVQPARFPESYQDSTPGFRRERQSLHGVGRESDWFTAVPVVAPFWRWSWT
jgi:hypothetical protein